MKYRIKSSHGRIRTVIAWDIVSKNKNNEHFHKVILKIFKKKYDSDIFWAVKEQMEELQDQFRQSKWMDECEYGGL